MGIFRPSRPFPSNNIAALRRALRSLFLFALLCCSTVLPSQNAAQTSHPTQDEVEAAYLYNFGKFVHWPPDPRRHTLDICILGKDPFGHTLDGIVANETIDRLRLTVTRLSGIASAQSCAILFIDASEAPHLHQDLFALVGRPVLTVSDLPDFVDAGGMVQFLVEDDRVRFAVNLAAADRAGLTFSSQLLKVAVRVVGTPTGKDPAPKNAAAKDRNRQGAQ